MDRIGIILSSVRAARKGESFARWIHRVASERGDAAYELVDLKEWPLGAWTADKPPGALEGTYAEGTLSRRWSDRVSELDLNIDGALALGFVVCRQVAALHEHGMAHHNITPNALLFKGASATRTVMPAMIGLVEPEMGAEAMSEDFRALAGMILQWLRPNRVAALHVRIKPLFEALRGKLSTWAFDPDLPTPSIEELNQLLGDALALVDFNFSVLRDSGGDLQEYALLLISLRLYHHLWPSSPTSMSRPAQQPAKQRAP